MSDALVKEIRDEVTKAIDNFKPHAFSWITDAVSRFPWGYWIHVAWVGDWNDEGRTPDDVTFLRDWISKDENIMRAINNMNEFRKDAP